MILQNDVIADFVERCDRAGINNPAAFLASKRHQVYDWLKGVFPFGILPTDIDGLVHLNAQFLLLEFKDAGVIANGIIPKGQMMCFNALAETSHFTIFIIGLDRVSEPVSMMEIHKSKRKSAVGITRDYIKARCAAWAAHVSAVNGRKERPISARRGNEKPAGISTSGFTPNLS